MNEQRAPDDWHPTDDATPGAAAFTWQQKVAALGRELDMRRRVYPDRVAKGRMTQAEADYQIAVFRSLYEDFAIWLWGWKGDTATVRDEVERRVRDHANATSTGLFGEEKAA